VDRPTACLPVNNFAVQTEAPAGILSHRNVIPKFLNGPFSQSKKRPRSIPAQ